MSRSRALLILATLSSSLVLAQAARAMDFESVTSLEGCAATCIVARGAIDAETSAQFRKFVARQRLGPGTRVVLDSLGGHHVQGIALGEAIRKLGFITHVGRYDSAGSTLGPGVCASACVYALLGGRERRIAPGSRVGVHQVRLPFSVQTHDASNEAQLLMALAATHLIQCGATADVVTLALSTPPDEIRWLSLGEMVQFGVVTEKVEGAEAVNQLAQADLARTIRYRLLGLPVAGSGQRLQ